MSLSCLDSVSRRVIYRSLAGVTNGHSVSLFVHLL